MENFASIQLTVKKISNICENYMLHKNVGSYCSSLPAFPPSVQVPPAVKALYSSPLPDIHEVPSLCHTLLTPREGVEWRRWEERERREFVAPRQPVFTHDQDEVRGRGRQRERDREREGREREGRGEIGRGREMGSGKGRGGGGGAEREMARVEGGRETCDTLVIISVHCHKVLWLHVRLSVHS